MDSNDPRFGQLIQAGRDNIDPRWKVQPSIEVCANQCGSKCCRTGFFSLTTKEKLRMQKLNPDVKYLKHDSTYWIVDFKMNGGQCPNLATDGSCSIWADRPEACRVFPSKPNPVCLVWSTETEIPQEELIESARKIWSRNA